MGKYVCCDCGCIFCEDDVAHWVEDHGLDSYGERWSGSPCCKENYVDAHECSCCGEIINTDQYVEIGDEKYCWDCVTIKKLEEI